MGRSDTDNQGLIAFKEHWGASGDVDMLLDLSIAGLHGVQRAGKRAWPSTGFGCTRSGTGNGWQTSCTDISGRGRSA